MKLNSFWTKLNRNAPEMPGGTPPADPPAGDAPVDTPVDTPAAADYGWMPEEYRADGQPNFDAFKTHYEDLIAESARRADADAAVPADGKYDFTLGDDFDHGVELPEGVKIDLDTDNEMFGELGQFLKEHHMPGGAAKGLVGLLAKYEAQRTAAAYASATKEFEALGATEAARNARVSSVQRSLETKLPKDEAEALMSMTQSAAGVKALEKLLMPRGVQSPTAQPQKPTTDGLSGYALLQAARAQG